MARETPPFLQATSVRTGDLAIGWRQRHFKQVGYRGANASDKHLSLHNGDAGCGLVVDDLESLRPRVGSDLKATWQPQ